MRIKAGVPDWTDGDANITQNEGTWRCERHSITSSSLGNPLMGKRNLLYPPHWKNVNRRRVHVTLRSARCRILSPWLGGLWWWSNLWRCRHSLSSSGRDAPTSASLENCFCCFGRKWHKQLFDIKSTELNSGLIEMQCFYQSKTFIASSRLWRKQCSCDHIKVQFDLI